MGDLNIKPNALFTEDNLRVLNGMNSECIDLIYLDPPFNSKRLYKGPVGSKAAGAAFKDMWTWQDVDWIWLMRLAEQQPHFAQFIQSIEKAHGQAMMAYIAYMAQRLFEMHRVLKPTGSIYLHCDQTAGHYLKIMLDFIFGSNNCLNDVVWSYRRWAGKAKHYQKMHDNLLFYAKNKPEQCWNWPMEPKADGTPKHKRWNERDPKTGKLVTRSDKSVKVDETNMRDVWEVGRLQSNAKESVGYPTQKPKELLYRIIQASSNEGDVVFDPFCGCATTCVAAQHLNRRWIGIDLEGKAVALVRERLETEIGVFNNFSCAPDLPFPDRNDRKHANPRSSDVRRRLFGEQEGRCNGCKHLFSIEQVETDHIIPRAKGGGSFYENYQLLCGNCNRIKGDRPMEYLLNVIKAREAQSSVFAKHIPFREILEKLQ